MSSVLNVRNLIEPDQSASAMAAVAAPSSLVLDIVNEISDVTGEIINSVANQQAASLQQNLTQQQSLQQLQNQQQSSTVPATSAQTSVIQENLSATSGSSSVPKRALDAKGGEKALKRAKTSSVSASFVVNLDFKTDKLETRLHDILCCKVCLDLPISTIYQVNFFNCFSIF